jgi:hypothetical protein
MPFDIEWTPEADEDFSRIDDPILASFVLDQIDLLATDPVGLSVRPGFPHRPLPKYTFWGPSDSNTHFTVLFRYAPDEKSIIIMNIGIVRY